MRGSSPISTAGARHCVTHGAAAVPRGNIPGMTLVDWLSEHYGNARKLARDIGVTPAIVSHWRSGARVVPVTRCVDVERATGGAVTRRELRPHDWSRYWPELDRRAPRGASSEVTIPDS